MNKQLPAQGTRTFEALRQTNEHGAEYWSARDLLTMLGYSQWRRFEDAIKRATTSCETSGNNPEHHFAGAGKMLELGSGSQREVEDYHLSRFACYLSAQNGDQPLHHRSAAYRQGYGGWRCESQSRRSGDVVQERQRVFAGTGRQAVEIPAGAA